MREFTLSVPDPVLIGGVEHATVSPSVTDAIEWDRLIARLRAGDGKDDDLLTMTDIVSRCIPSFDVRALPVRDLVRLGMMLVSGADTGNASGAAGRSTKQPSSPTSSPETPAKSSPGPQKKSGSGRGSRTR